MEKVNTYQNNRTHAQRVNEIAEEIEQRDDSKNFSNIQMEINKIELSLTEIRLEQLSMEYALQRLKVLSNRVKIFKKNN